MSIKNAKIIGKVFYGMHFVPGVAEYQEQGKEPYRIYLNEETIRSMNPSFSGRPVYVKHVEEVDLDKVDGYVVESFYNAADGKTWVKFMITTDEGLKAIQTGWKLSNAYIPKGFAGGGLWNGVEYLKEVTSGEFEHLAIVPNPRYDESIILTPEQFKEYNLEKEMALRRVANSNKGEESVLKIFKKTKVENAVEYESIVVTLPKSGVDKTIAQLVEEADAIHNMHGYANPEHMVKVNDEEMTVSEMADCYGKMKASMEEEKKKNEEEKEKGEGEKKENGEAPPKSVEKMEEKEVKAEEKKSNSGVDHFSKLKNADKGGSKGPQVIEISSTKLERGKKRYG